MINTFICPIFWAAEFSLSIIICAFCLGNYYLLLKLCVIMISTTSIDLLESHDIIKLAQRHTMILLVKHCFMSN